MIRVHIWIITLISWGGDKSTYLDCYFNKRVGEGADESTYLDYYFNKREVGGGGKSTYLDFYFNNAGGGWVRVHIWIITLISA